MLDKFTTNQLVKYLYKETDWTESLAIRKALQQDYSLFQQFQELKFSFTQLPKVQFNPKKSTINSILKYSQEATLEAH